MILKLKGVSVSTFKHPERVTYAWPAEPGGKAIDVGEQASTGESIGSKRRVYISGTVSRLFAESRGNGSGSN